MDEKELIQLMKDNISIETICEEQKYDQYARSPKIKVILGIYNGGGKIEEIDSAYISKQDIEAVIKELD
jgi:hypothetical protein